MAGSVMGALADDIWSVIFARALQGSGAVSAAVTALVADQTRDIVRTRAMAFLGITIGGTFILALVLGPLLNTWIGVPGLFWLTAVFAAISLLLVVFVVPAAGQGQKTQTLNLWMVIASIREPGLRRARFEIDLDPDDVEFLMFRVRFEDGRVAACGRAESPL